MADTKAVEPRRKEAESEKITINVGFVDLGHIDLLVEEGFYSNRTDFIRTAIRNQVLAHGEVLKNTVARRSMVLGLQRFTRQDLEKVLASGEQLHIHVLGLATIDDDVLVVAEGSGRRRVTSSEIVPRPAGAEGLIVERVVVTDDAALDAGDSGGP